MKTLGLLCLLVSHEKTECRHALLGKKIIKTNHCMFGWFVSVPFNNSGYVEMVS